MDTFFDTNSLDNTVNICDTNVFQVYSAEEVILFGFPMSPASCGATVVNLMLPVTRKQ